LKIFDVFYGRLEYLTDIKDIFGQFGTFPVLLVHFSGFGIMPHGKSGNPVSQSLSPKPLSTASGDLVQYLHCT
jgi:hypothetical protein